MAALLQPDDTTPHNNDPLFYRDYGLVHVGFKEMNSTQFAPPIIDWIITFFNKSVATNESARLHQMEQKRNILKLMSECDLDSFDYDAFERTYLPAASQYINDLASLISKTQGTLFEGGIPNLRFIWNHWMGAEYGQIDTNSLRVELCCVIFNLAAAYSLMGCILPNNLKKNSVIINGIRVKESIECLTHRVKMFKLSAMLFNNLKERLKAYQINCDDLWPEVASLCCDMMLAQAQTCYYQAAKQNYTSIEEEHNHALLALAASTYYGDFVEKYKASCEVIESDSNGIELSPSNSIPGYWVVHCSTVRSFMRVSVLVHYAKSIETDGDKYGHIIGYLGKCHVILSEQQNYLREFSDLPADHPLYVVLEKKLIFISQKHEALKHDNVKIYHQPFVSPEQIDSLSLKPMSKVALTAYPDPVTYPLLEVIFKVPKDAFSSILSVASSQFWMEYRQKRIAGYLTHLKVMAQREETFITVMESHPEYIFLYWMYHRLKASLCGSPAPGLFQNRLGSEIMLIRNPAMFTQVANIVEKQLPEVKRKASSSMIKLREDIAQMRKISGADLVDKRFITLENEHTFVVDSHVSQTLSYFSRVRELYESINSKTAETEKVFQERFFGPRSFVMFSSLKPTTHSPLLGSSSVTRYATKQPGGGGEPISPQQQQSPANSSTWSITKLLSFSSDSSSTIPPPPPPSDVTNLDQDSYVEGVSSYITKGPRQATHPLQKKITPDQSPGFINDQLQSLAQTNNAVCIGLLIYNLIDCTILEREKLEDALAQDMLLDIERKDVELAESELVDMDSWVENKREWMRTKFEDIGRQCDREKELYAKLEEVDPGVEILNGQIISVLEPILAALCQSMAEREATTSPPPSPLPPTTATTGGVPIVKIEGKKSGGTGFNISEAQKDINSPYSALPLWNVVKGVSKFRQCKRFATLCKRMEEIIEEEASAISTQCADVIAETVALEAYEARQNRKQGSGQRRGDRRSNNNNRP